VNYDESIAGISVIQHNETPGLGDKIEPRKSDWLQQFKGLSLTNTPAEDWKVKKDGGRFDAFTGATITPRAVLKAIARGLAFFHANKSVIFNSPNSCGVQHE
jgi:electron transport complex protein RnfG